MMRVHKDSGSCVVLGLSCRKMLKCATKTRTGKACALM